MFVAVVTLLLGGAVALAVFLASRGLDDASAWAGVFALFLTAGGLIGRALASLWRAHALTGAEGPAEVVDADVPVPLELLQLGRGGVPALPDRTFGREADVAEVMTLFRAGARLVCIRGTGGVGKTRLALEVAHRMRTEWADGVAFVPLADVDEDRSVPAAVAAGLGLSLAEADPVVALTTVLADRSLLLVVDNVEHVLEAAWLLSDLLAASPGLRILVTSRIALDLSGERDYPLAPLPTDGDGEDAVALFVDRFRAHDPDFEPTAEERVDIRAICALCDGLPLAVELAAARARVRSIAELRDTLGESLPELGGGRRDAPSRQTTLRACVGWSIDTLSAEQRRFLLRLSVFRGGFTIDAAATVGNVESADVLDRLDALVAHSLVYRTSVREGHARFDLLAPVRVQAAELLGRDTEPTRVRHCEYYRSMVGLVPHAAVALTTAQWRRLSAERANLRVAVDAAQQMGDAGLLADLVMCAAWTWYTLGPAEELTRWLQVVAEDPSTPAGRQVDAWYYLCRLRRLVGDLDGMVEAVDRARRVVEEIHDPEREWLVLQSAMFVASEQEDGARYDELVRQMERGERSQLASLHLPIVHGMSAWNRGDVDGAVRSYEAAARLALQHDAPYLVGVAVNNLCDVAINAGDQRLLQKALPWVDRGLVATAAVEDIRGYGDLLAQRGTARLLLGDVEPAMDDLLLSARADMLVRRDVEAEETALSLAAACAELGHDRLAVLAWTAYLEAVRAAASEERPAAQAIRHQFLEDLGERLGADEFLAAEVEGRALVAEHGPRMFLPALAKEVGTTRAARVEARS